MTEQLQKAVDAGDGDRDHSALYAELVREADSRGVTTDREGVGRPETVPEELTGVLTADPPRFDEARRRAARAAAFGFDGEVERRFESERDQNFLLRGDGDARRILKISNAGERADVLDMEVAAARHALRVDPSLPDRGAVPDRAGTRIATSSR